MPKTGQQLENPQLDRNYCCCPLENQGNNSSRKHVFGRVLLFSTPRQQLGNNSNYGQVA